MAMLTLRPQGPAYPRGWQRRICAALLGWRPMVGGTAATKGSAARGNSCYGFCSAAQNSAAKIARGKGTLPYSLKVNF